MDEGTYKSDKKSYYFTFPKNRDFFLLDKSDNIKEFKTSDIKDPEYIFVIYLDIQKKVRERIYNRNLFLVDYEFIRVLTDNDDVYINFLIRKEDFIKAREIRLISMIKKRKSYFKEIFRKTQINFGTKNDYIAKEATSIPNDLKFYNRIFKLYIGNQSLTTEQNTQNQIDKNFNHSNNINNNNNFNCNNINTGNNNNQPNNNINNNNNIFQNQKQFQDNNQVVNNSINDGDIDKNSETQMIIKENYFNNNQNINDIDKNSDYKEYIEINKVTEINQKKGGIENQNQNNQCNDIQKPNTNITFSSNPSL